MIELENKLMQSEVEIPEPPISKNLFRRLFSKMNQGSLRLVVINLILCGTTGTYFWYPYFLKVYGVYAGICGIMFACFISYQNVIFLVNACLRYQENEYLILVERILGRWAFITGRFTYFFDYFVTYVSGLLLYWNVIQYLLYYQGVFDDSMRSSTTELEFKIYHPKIMIYRLFAMIGALLVLIPLFMKRNMHGLKFVFFSYIGNLFLLIGYLFYDLQEFRAEYQRTNQLTILYTKPIKIDSFQYVLIFLSGFYVQSNVFTMKMDLLNATKERLKKTVDYSHIFFILFGLSFGIYGYFCLGDKYTTYLFMLRQSFKGKKHELIYRSILIWSCVNFIIYLAFFNLSFIKLINSFTQRPINQKIVIFGPLIFAVLLTFLYPKIEKILGINAIFVCLINGFIFPTLMRRKMDIEDGCSKFKTLFWNFQIVFYLIVSLISLEEILRAELGWGK